MSCVKKDFRYWKFCTGKFYFLVTGKKVASCHLQESSKYKQMLSSSPINYTFFNFKLPQSMSLDLLLDDFLSCLAASSLHCFHGNTSETLLLSEEVKCKVAGIFECLNI